MDTTSRSLEKHSGIEKKLDLMQRRIPILRILYPNSVMTETELAEKAGVDKGNFSRNLDELEETGLVSTYKEKSKGNDRRMVNLSDLSIEVLSAFDKREKPASPIEILTDEKYLTSTLTLLRENDQEVRRVASRELVNICRSYIVPVNTDLLLYMEKGLTTEEDREVASHMLEALSALITNTSEALEKAKTQLATQVTTVAMEQGKVVDRRVTDYAIKILATIFEGESRYKLLLEIYKQLIKNGSQSSRTAIDILIGRHPEKRKEIRQSLLKIFKDTSGEGRDLIRGHLSII